MNVPLVFAKLFNPCVVVHSALGHEVDELLVCIHILNNSEEPMGVVTQTLPCLKFYGLLLGQKERSGIVCEKAPAGSVG